VTADAVEKRVRRQDRPYLAYLLRLWRVSEEGQTGWRASVENAHTGERRAFAGLAALFSFLENEVGKVQREPNTGRRRGRA
jgi:hypothetical protein